MRSSRRSVTLIAAAVLFLGTTPWAALAAQQRPVVDRAAFVSHPAMADAQISPDGSWLAFRAPLDDVMQLWLSPVHAVDAAVPLSGGRANSFSWSRDSRHLLFLRDDAGDENDHLYAVPVDTSGTARPRDLTPVDGIRARVYALPDTTPTVVLVGLNDRDSAAYDVYRVDITTGVRQLVQRNPGDVADWVLDRQGTVRLGLRYDAVGGLELARVSGDSLTPVFYCEPDETCRPMGFHWDDRRLYLATDQGSRDLSELILFHPDTFEEETVERDPEGRVDFGDAVFTPDGDLVATVYHDDTTRVYGQDSTFAAALAALAQQLPVAGLGIGGASSNEALWIVRAETDTVPGATYLFNAWTSSLELLADSRPALSGRQLARASWVRYPAQDGGSVPALLTLPPDTPPSALPAVILPHDGPRRREHWGFDPFAQFLANRGYAVLQPDFRGSSGYGKAWRAAGNGAWGTGIMQQDLADGARYLVERGIADPARLGIVGVGYGGYAALAALAFTPDRFAAGVAVGAMSDLPRFLAELPAPERAGLTQLYHAIGDPDDPQDLARLESQSPVGAAARITAPVLLVHGVDDARVSVEQTERMVGALRRAQRAVEYLRVSGEGREFRAASRRVAVAAVLERFLARHLGGRVQDSVTAPIAAVVDSITVGSGDALGPAATALTAPLPPADGTRIAQTTLVYRLAVSGADELEVVRRIVATRRDGRDIWRVIDSTMVPVYPELTFDPASVTPEPGAAPPAPPLEPPPGTGNMAPAADTLELDRATLIPVERRVGGPLTYRLRYTADSVVGEYEIGDFFDDVAAALEAPVFADGPGLDLVIAALPLGEGYETALRVFDAQLRQVVPLTLSVTGTTRVQTPAGGFDAFQLSLVPLGVRDAQARSLVVRRQAPHIVLRGDSSVPGDPSGFALTIELVGER